jgi:hypothetical protein
MPRPLEKYLDTINQRAKKSKFISFGSKALCYSTIFAILVFLYDYYYSVGGYLYGMVILPLLSLLAVIGYLLLSKPSREEAALLSDRALNNHDRFTTALECIKKGDLNSVEKELLERVDFEVVTSDARKVVSIKPTWETKSLAALVPIFGIIAASFIYTEVIKAVTPIIQQTMLAAPVSRLESKIKELAASGSPEKKDIAKKLQGLLDKLKGAKDIDDMLGQAQGLLQQLKDSETDPDVRATLDKLGQAADFLSKSKMTRELSDALKNGDMSKAAGLVSNLSSKLQSMSGLTSKDLKKLGKNFQGSASSMAKAADKGSGQPGSGQPGSGQPGSGQPGSGQPGSGQPGSGQPGSGQPGSGQPGSGQPGSGQSAGGTGSLIEKQFSEVGQALQRGDIGAANKALEEAGKLIGDIAKKNEARQSFKKVGEIFEQSLNKLSAEHGQNSGNGAGKGSGSQGNLPSVKNDGKGTDGNDKSSQSGKAGDSGNANDSGQAANGKGPSGKSENGREGTSSSSDGTRSGEVSSANSTSKTAGSQTSNGTLNKTDNVTGNRENNGQKVNPNLTGFSADSSGTAGKVKVVDSLPFALPPGQDKDDSLFKYEQKVNDYLSTQLVPGEYREVINDYFGIEKRSE